MAEYVFEIDESRADAMGNVPCERREEVVRCRDCKYAREEGTVCNWFADFDGVIIPSTVEPDGFCAWGQKEES